MKNKKLVFNNGPLTFLQVGMVFLHGGCKYRVDMVNNSRARCVPVDKVKVERKMFDKRSGEEKVVVFEHAGTTINISPNSEVQIVKK